MTLALSVTGHKIIYNINAAHTHGNRDFACRINRKHIPHGIRIKFRCADTQLQKVTPPCTDETLS